MVKTKFNENIQWIMKHWVANNFLQITDSSRVRLWWLLSMAGLEWITLSDHKSKTDWLIVCLFRLPRVLFLLILAWVPWEKSFHQHRYVFTYFITILKTNYKRNRHTCTRFYNHHCCLPALIAGCCVVCRCRYIYA